MNLSFNSIRARLLLLILLITLPMLGLTLYTAAEERRHLASAVQEESGRILGLASSRQEELIGQTRDLLAVLARLPAVNNGFSEYERFFPAILEHYPFFINFRIVGPDGNLIYSARPVGTSLSFAGEDYFKKAVMTGEFTVGHYTLGRITGKPLLPCAYPVHDEKGKVKMLLLVSLDLDWINHLAAATKLPPGSALTVVDSKGTILARSPDPEKWVGRMVPESPLIKSILSRKGEGTVESAGLDGVPRIYTYMPLLKSNEGEIYIYAGIPAQAAYAGYRRTLQRNITGTVLVTLFTAIIAWAGSNAFFLRKVKSLLYSTGQLASGNLGARIGVTRTRDELDQLAQSFDQMAAALEERTGQLHFAEEKYRALVEQIPVISYIADPGKTGDKLYVSPQVASITGFTAEQILAEPRIWAGLIHPGDRDRVLSHMRHSFNNGARFRSEYRLITRNGQVVWVHDEARLVRDENGSPRFMQGIILDITEKRKADETIAKLSNQNHLILNSAGEGIFGLDSSGRFTFVNPAAATMIGHEPGDLIGQGSHSVFHHTKSDGSPYPLEECPICMTLRDGQVHFVSDELFWRKDGSGFPAEYISTPIMEHESVIGAVVVFRDITERKRYERELKTAKEAAEAANRAKGQFLANMSHEIRTPMNIIIGMTELLLDTSLDHKQRELAGLVGDSAESLLTIINDILDISKIEAGKLDLEKEEFEPIALVKSIGETMAVAAGEKKLDLSINTDSTPAVRVLGDPVRLRQVLLNLVSNAIKFTALGGISLNVMPVFISETEVSLRFEVNDTGIGISEDNIRNIFRSFVQVDSSSTRTHGGTGLGLSISKQLVELMGGEMGVNSQPGKGSTFWFTVTFRLCPSNGVAMTDPPEREASAPLSHPGKTILLAEDNPVNRKLTEAQLNNLGYAVKSVKNGREAVDAALGGASFALILMDCQMPVMDGFEATRLIRRERSGTGKKIPVIAMTAYAMQGDRELCLDAGMDDYLSKPVKLETLKETLEKWVT